MMHKLLLLSSLFFYFGANGQSVLLADSVNTHEKSELYQKDTVYFIGGINIIGNKKTKSMKTKKAKSSLLADFLVKTYQ